MEKLLKLFVHQDGRFRGAFRETQSYRLEEFRMEIEGLSQFCDGDLRERLFWLSRGITERKFCPVCGIGVPWKGTGLFRGFIRRNGQKNSSEYFKKYCSDRCKGIGSNCWSSSKVRSDLKNIIDAETLRAFVEKWMFTERGIIDANVSRILDNNFRKVLEECVPQYGRGDLIEHLFWFMEGLTDYPKTCKRPGCEKKVTFFKSWSYDIRDYCSGTCAQSDPAVQEQKMVSKIAKFGKKQNTEKIRETCLLRYGVENPSQVPEIFDKIIANQLRWKLFELPSGRIIKVQGYEDQALTMLLEKYDEGDLVTERKLVPKIRWADGEGKLHYHFPDIFIPKENRLIEVKSSWTLKCQGEDTVNRKKSAAEALGYAYDLMIL